MNLESNFENFQDSNDPESWKRPKDMDEEEWKERKDQLDDIMTELEDLYANAQELANKIRELLLDGNLTKETIDRLIKLQNLLNSKQKQEESDEVRNYIEKLLRELKTQE